MLKKIQEYGLKVRIDKCSIEDMEINFLGFIASGKGIRPDSNKVKALSSLPYPKNVKQLQSQLGLFNYFSRFIPKFATIAAHLYTLTRKERKLSIIDEDKKVIDTMMKYFTRQCLLVNFNPEKRIKISVDASSRAIRGLSMQETYEEDVWEPISYFSSILRKYQQNYTVTEKEILAVIIGVRKFQHYLTHNTISTIFNRNGSPRTLSIIQVQLEIGTTP